MLFNEQSEVTLFKTEEEMLRMTQEVKSALTHEACKVLAEYPEGLHMRDVFSAVAKRCAIPEALLQPIPGQPGKLKFHNRIAFDTTDEAKARWLDKDGSGKWRLTELGRAALKKYPTPSIRETGPSDTSDMSSDCGLWAAGATTQ